MKPVLRGVSVKEPGDSMARTQLQTTFLRFGKRYATVAGVFSGSQNDLRTSWSAEFPPFDREFVPKWGIESALLTILSVRIPRFIAGPS